MHAVHQRDNLTACLLMVVSMAFFAVEDLFLKWSASELPAGQIIAMLGLAGAALLAAVTRHKGQRVWSRQALTRPAMIRCWAEGLGNMLYVPALALVSLSVNAAILQAAPLVVTLGAALFLGEHVGWRRWSAIAVGLAGVIVILRPGTEGFQWAAVLTVLCVVLLAARDLTTRTVPHSITTLQLMTWGYMAIVPAGLILMLIQRDAPVLPLPHQWTGLGVALVCGLIGYYAVTLATRLGEASAVAPFRYTRLVFALILAGIFLGERPDAFMLTGTLLVIGSGLYTFAREARLRRQASPVAGQPV